MKSINQIKNDLRAIASSHNLSGAAIDLQVDLLGYLLYNSQVDIINATKEVGLNTSMLLNSKIARCLDFMYSVYRGRNPRALIPTRILTTTLNYEPFEPIYIKGGLYIYAANSINLTHNVSNMNIMIDGNCIQMVEGILSNGPAYEVDIKPDSINAISHYIDLKLDGSYLSDLSEDLWIGYRDDTQDGEGFTSVKWTREFIDHVNSIEDENLIYVSTIQDYGIRLYRKQGFLPSETWRVKVLKYADNDTFSTYGLENIKIPLTQSIPDMNREYTMEDLITTDNKLTTNNPNYDPEVFVDYVSNLGYNILECNMYDTSFIVPSKDRMNDNSILYYANEAARVGGYIRSNYDVSHLFYEYFIDQVLESEYILLNNTQSQTPNWEMCFFYIPRLGAYINNSEFDQFKDDRAGYIVGYNGQNNTSNLDLYYANASERILSIKAVVYTEGNCDITNDVNKILDEYRFILDKKVNLNEIRSKISKIEKVRYVDSLELTSWKEVIPNNLYNSYMMTDQMWLDSMQLNGIQSQIDYIVGSTSPLQLDQVLLNNKCRYFDFDLVLIQNNYYELIS